MGLLKSVIHQNKANIIWQGITVFQCFDCNRRFIYRRLDNSFILPEEDYNTIINKSGNICLACLPNIELILI